MGECDVPVTAKIRSGRVPDRIVAPEFAKALEAAGASAVAVHGRCASQLYRGNASWDVIRDVVGAVSVPVIGSGDVMGPYAAAAMVAETGATASFVARGSYGNPWIFSQAKAVLEGSPIEVQANAHRRLAAFRCHVRMLEATGAHLARARSLAGWYLKGMPNAGAWRNLAMTCVGVDDYLSLADRVESEVS